MVNPVSGGAGVFGQPNAARKAYGEKVDGDKDRGTGRADAVLLGKGAPLSNDDKAKLVVERALDRLRAVVGDARKELGLPEDAVIDTSPEATGQRIVDFALGFFDKYAKQNGLENNEEGRKQFADFIGGAIPQGIDEARGILGALNALDGNTGSNIDKTADYITNKLDEFVKKGL